MSTYDVCAVGSALVDILAESGEEEVAALGLVKGSMQLVDLAASDAIHARLGPAVERSGGSAANTVAGLASLGATVGFIGRVASDRFGEVFTADLAELGVTFGGTALDGATGRCLVLVTPDADRTMCTTLGAASLLGRDDLDLALIRSAQITYLEGYLWDEPVAIDALRAVIETAHRAGNRVALSLSDPFCVDRHRTEWIELVAADVDLVFGNEAELCSLYEVGDLAEACGRIARPGLIVTVTRGAEGALAFEGLGEPVTVSADPVERVVDTTGAGDLYAAGFLYGLVRGASLGICARYGAIAAAEVISHIGARPQQDLTVLLVGA
ncbi:MAG: adenosine kinase [Acidimicrobiales bacterium]